MSLLDNILLFIGSLSAGIAFCIGILLMDWIDRRSERIREERLKERARKKFVKEVRESMKNEEHHEKYC
jgi:hypothetical protein